MIDTRIFMVQVADVDSVNEPQQEWIGIEKLCCMIVLSSLRIEGCLTRAC